jgi:hypothetical protein
MGVFVFACRGFGNGALWLCWAEEGVEEEQREGLTGKRLFAQMNQMKTILGDVMSRAAGDWVVGRFGNRPFLSVWNKDAGVASRSQFVRAREGLGQRAIKANQGKSR